MTDDSRCAERTFYLRAGGHRLRARTISPSGATPAGETPTLVFLHEGLGSIEQWRDFPCRLAQATGLAALIYDRYGHGGSEPLREPREMDYHRREAHDTLPEVLAACGIEAPVLIGHSDGGTIALLYSARFPEKPRGVITEAAHVLVDEVTLAGIREAVRAYEGGGLRERLARYHGAGTELLFRGWSDVWLAPGYRQWSIEGTLCAIRCPVLVIQGEEDEYGSALQMEAILNRVSGRGERLLIPRCGHIPHHQARETVLGEMTRFIAGL